MIYITELGGEFKSVCQILQVVIVSLGGGAPKAILTGGLVKSTGHIGDLGGG
jgi:hypothetical protein